MVKRIAKLNSRNRIAKSNPAPQSIKLDIGCGPNKKPGFVGIDAIAFPGVDIVHDLCKRWPFEDGTVEEANCSHCLEHFDRWERVHFLNELWRVMKIGAKCDLVVPDFSSGRAYGDPTHQWPPLCSFATYYWKKDWRMANAPHTDIAHNPKGFTCNFQVVGGFSLHPEIAVRNQEYQQHAMNFFKEACQDLVATMTKLA